MQDKTTVDRRTFLRLSGLAGITGITGVASADSGRESDSSPDEVLVGVNSTRTSPRAAVERHLPSNTRIRHENTTLGYAVVELPQKQKASTQAVEARGPIEYVEPNRTHQAFYTPNDPGFDEQYADQLVNAPAA